MRKIVILPVFNEEEHIERLLPQLEDMVDIFIVVNDGSFDSSEEKILQWAKDRKNVYYEKLASNKGMACALKRGFCLVEQLLREGKIGNEDLVITMDADGQHNPEYIPAMLKFMQGNDLDILLTRRDFSPYPLYRKLGNKMLSLYASILSGHKYKDVESGFRIMRASVIPCLLRYYVGFGYSNAQEIAIISGLLKLKINNEYLTQIAYYKSGGPNVFDALIVATMSMLVFLRVISSRSKTRS